MQCNEHFVTFQNKTPDSADCVAVRARCGGCFTRFTIHYHGHFVVVSQ